MLQHYAAKFVYRPPRRIYHLSEIADSLYSSGGSVSPRVRLNFLNSRGQNIVGSLYKATKDIGRHPCVVYMHGNASSQKEGQFLVYYLAHLGVSVCLFDFSGCGLSDGDKIGLGVLERDDVSSVIKELRENHGIDDIILWGRSMGAGTAAWYASENNDISGIICDSVYISIRDICNDFAERNMFSGALWVLSLILYPWINLSVKWNAKYSMKDIYFFDKLKNAKAPALFIHAYEDNFIGIREAREIFAEYGGEEKYLITCPGGHNSARPNQIIYEGIEFIKRVFNINDEKESCEKEETGYQPVDRSEQHFESVADMIMHK